MISYSKHNILILIANVFRESKMFHPTVFFYSILCIQYPGDISLKQAILLPSTSNFFAPIASLCSNMRPQVKNITTVYVFRLSNPL